MTIFLFIIIFNVLCGASNNSNEYTWLTNGRYSYPSLPIVNPRSENDLCRSHSQLFLKELENRSLWAMQMWDSSAKSPNGVFSGSIYQFGNFDECLKIMAPFKLQFCIVQYHVNLSSENLDDYNTRQIIAHSNGWKYIVNSGRDPSKVPRNLLNWGLCVPAACQHPEIENAINSYLETYHNNIVNETIFKVEVNEDFCTKDDDIKIFSSGEIIFWAFTSSLLFLTISSTLMDFLINNTDVKKTKAYQLWMIFSIKKNYRIIFSRETREKNSLDVFHGIKFLSILFVVYGHRIGVSLSLSAMNFNEIEDSFIKDHKMFFLHADLVVDTFFFISGLLASYILMGIYSQRFINPIYPIIVRLSRLSPLYFFVVWYQSTAAFRAGSGPLWNALAKNETQFCRDNWWTNILYINNYIKTEEMCMQHSWFLPCELHFFSLATFLIAILLKNKKIGYFLIVVVMIGSFIIPSIIIYSYKIQPLILFYYEFLSQPRKNKSFNLLYIKSHNRATVYFIGTAVGIFLHRTKDWKKQFSKKAVVCGCLAWLSLMFLPMAYGSVYYEPNKTYDVLESTIFGSLRRISWALGLTVFILCHRFGTIPLMDIAFSNNIAIFFSKITYGIYLTHFTLIVSDVLSQRSQKYFSVGNVIIEGIGDLLKAGTITIVLMFILEIPLRRILKEIIFASQVKKFENQPDSNLVDIRL